MTEPKPKITIEGLDESIVRTALAATGISGYSMDVERPKEAEPPLGYASYKDLVNFAVQNAGEEWSSKTMATRVWNTLIRESDIDRSFMTPRELRAKVG